MSLSEIPVANPRPTPRAYKWFASAIFRMTLTSRTSADTGHSEVSVDPERREQGRAVNPCPVLWGEVAAVARPFLSEGVPTPYRDQAIAECLTSVILSEAHFSRYAAAIPVPG